METKCWYCFCSFNVSSFNVRSQEAQGKGLIKIQREKKTIIKLHLVQGCQFWHFWCDKTAGQEVNQTQITHPPPPTSQTTPNSICSIVSFARWNVCKKIQPWRCFLWVFSTPAAFIQQRDPSTSFSKVRELCAFRRVAQQMELFVTINRDIFILLLVKAWWVYWNKKNTFLSCHVFN